jgi:hypothetical protein
VRIIIQPTTLCVNGIAAKLAITATSATRHVVVVRISRGASTPARAPAR